MNNVVPETCTLPVTQGILYFPEGLPGFENLNDFVLIEDQELGPVVFMVAVTEPKIGFSVVPIPRLRPDYQLELSAEDRRLLGLDETPQLGADLLCLAIVNLGDGTQPATANLFAPVVVNLKNWRAKQVMQIEGSYSSVTEV